MFENHHCRLRWFVFWVFELLYFGVHNFLDFISFGTFFSAPDAPIGGVYVLFGHHKQQSPPLWSGLPWAVKCSVTSRFTLILTILLNNMLEIDQFLKNFRPSKLHSSKIMPIGLEEQSMNNGKAWAISWPMHIDNLLKAWILKPLRFGVASYVIFWTTLHDIIF